MRLTEGNDQAVYLSATVSLSVPAGVDYELFVYCAACSGVLAASSTNGPGVNEQVGVRWDDDFGMADDGDILIQVRYWSGAAPLPWTLQIAANTAVSAPTCDF